PYDPTRYGDIFIDGGRWWVSKDPDDENVVRLSDANDPEGGNGMMLAGAGEGLSEIAVLESGRRLAMLLGGGEEPKNLYTVDVSEGTIHAVATHVAQVCYGTNRILARSLAATSGDL